MRNARLLIINFATNSRSQRMRRDSQKGRVVFDFYAFTFLQWRWKLYEEDDAKRRRRPRKREKEATTKKNERAPTQQRKTRGEWKSSPRRSALSWMNRQTSTWCIIYQLHHNKERIETKWFFARVGARTIALSVRPQTWDRRIPFFLSNTG